MFEIISLAVKNLYSVRYTVDGKSVEFPISSVISKRQLDAEPEGGSFLLLNAYLDYKGKEFKHRLMDELTKSHQTILFNAVEEIFPLDSTITQGILELFDLRDIFNFLKFTYVLKPPSDLKDVFDFQIELDAQGTRVQTYLKDDYLELAALAMPIKATLGPICFFSYIHQAKINKLHREYILLGFYSKQHHIYESDAMVKLLGLIDKLVNVPDNSNKLPDNIMLIEKQMPKDELPKMLLGTVLFQRLSLATLADDTNERNIVTKIYNYVNHKLSGTGDISKSIRSKEPRGEAEAEADSSRESFAESYRGVTDITAGMVEELKYATSTIDIILRQLPESIRSRIDPKVLADSVEFVRKLHGIKLIQTQLDLLAILFKSILDPRSISYLDINSLLNLFAVGFAYLWGIDSKQLALLLTSRVEQFEEDVLTINGSINRSRIQNVQREELDQLYPYRRIVNASSTVNVVEESISNMAITMYSYKWVPTAFDSYVVEVLGELNYNLMLPPTLKVDLATAIIQNERLIHDV